MEEENAQLRESLALALGERRATDVLGNTRDTPRNNPPRSSAPADGRVDDTVLIGSLLVKSMIISSAQDNGRKRHIATDTLGLLLAVVVTSAGIQDRDGAHRLLVAVGAGFSTISHIWADGGYTGRLVTWANKVLAHAVQIVKRSDTSTGFSVLPRRWVVERTFGWITKHRRCVRGYETLPATTKTWSTSP